MKYVVFDVETRIDKALLRAIYFPGEALSDDEAYHRVRHQLRAEHGNDFIPLSFHVPISIAWGSVDDTLVLTSVETLALPARDETALVREFWQRMTQLTCPLVSFSGRQFDLPVLELRALHLGLAVPKYFNDRQSARTRYSDRHYDLYEFASNYGAYRIRGGLNLLAKLVGLPGKTDVAGEDVQRLWEAGDLDAIDRYCRSDVVQTYFLLLRIERLRGRITADEMERLWAAGQCWRDALTR